MVRDILTIAEWLGHDEARRLVSYSIYRQQLEPQPCEICGGYGKRNNGKSLVEAHHDDYNKPLNIRWLCFFHHREWHKTNKPIKIIISPEHRIIVDKLKKFLMPWQIREWLYKPHNNLDGKRAIDFINSGDFEPVQKLLDVEQDIAAADPATDAPGAQE